MKILLLCLGIIVALVVLAGLGLYLLGRAQPERHAAAITFALSKPRAAVWVALTDYASMPRWWPAVQAVRFETRADGEVLTWNKDAHGKEIAFRTKEEKAPVRLVREIVGDDLPFGGTWTYELAEDAGGTRMTLTEDGYIKPPLLRGIARLFMKPDATMRDFEKHFVPYVGSR